MIASSTASLAGEGIPEVAGARARLRGKRALDLALAVPGLVVLAPLLALVAIAVRLDSPGPALFVQERLGQGGRRFRMLKFRTMRVGASELRRDDGTVVTVRDDARVTRLGRWLRRSSIDELPQLINVVLGQMSLVGPRPELPDGLGAYSPAHLVRLAVPPGITGWAQIQGRNLIPLQQRRDLDCWYATRAGVRLDLHILVRTVGTVVTGRGVTVPAGRTPPPTDA